MVKPSKTTSQLQKKEGGAVHYSASMTGISLTLQVALKDTPEVCDLVTTINEINAEMLESERAYTAGIQRAIGNLKQFYEKRGIGPTNNYKKCDHPHLINDGKGDVMCAVCERYNV